MNVILLGNKSKKGWGAFMSDTFFGVGGGGDREFIKMGLYTEVRVLQPRIG